MAVQLRIPYGVAGRQHIVLDDAGCVVAKGQTSNVVAGVTKTAARIDMIQMSRILMARRRCGGLQGTGTRQ
jgi:ethanolamine ammonia-lyase large subunit